MLKNVKRVVSKKRKNIFTSIAYSVVYTIARCQSESRFLQKRLNRSTWLSAQRLLPLHKFPTLCSKGIRTPQK